MSSMSKLAIRNALVVLGLAAAGSALASVTFYERENFGGREVTFDTQVVKPELANFPVRDLGFMG